MQTSSKPRNSSSEVPQRTTPVTSRSNGSSEVPQRTSPATPKSTRVKKTGGNESESATSRSTPTKNLIDRSPKSIGRRSPISPVTERKRLSRVTELESQLTQLQEDLKKTKDKLGSSESWRRQAQQEAEEAKKQHSAMTVKLEDSQRQFMDFSAAEEARLQELRKFSHERDRAWQSELEATQKQNSVDSAALTTALNEIHRLKQQLEMVVKSEDAQAKESETLHSELHALKQDMGETLSIVEYLKSQLRNSEMAEAEAHHMVHDTQQQLEMAKTDIESLHLDSLKLIESASSKASELEESIARANFLEESVKKLQAAEHTVDHEGIPDKNPGMDGHSSLESEVEKLRSALEVAEMKYQEEQIQSTIQIRSAFELAGHVRIDCAAREAELELALKNAKAEIFESKARFIGKETELESISDMNRVLTAEVEKRVANQMNSELEAKLMNSIADVAELKANLLDKETKLQNILEENELLKAEMKKREMENSKNYESVNSKVEEARAAEKDAVLRLGCVTEEADKNSRRAARVAEQLEAAQAVNSEMEVELRRLRVQSDQWRKAAEAAAAALTPGNDGRFVERSSSLDTEYQSVAGKLMSSPFSDDLDDDSPKKKNNVMRKISGLWKKNPK